LTEISKFIKNTVVYGLGKGLRKFIGFFLFPFYTRALTPSDYGVLDTLAVGIFIMTIVLSVGMDSATGRFFYVAKTEIEKGKVLFTGLVFRLLSIIPSVILSLFSAQISVALFETDQYSWVVFLSLMLVPLQSLGSDQEHLFRYFFDPWKYNFVTIVRICLRVSLGIYLVLILREGVWGAQLATFATSIIIFFLSFLKFNRKRYYYQFSWYWAKKMLRYGFPLIFAGIGSWVLVSSDRLILLHFHGTEAVGLYGIGGKLAMSLQILAIAVNMSWGPHLMNKYESDISENKIETKKLVSSVWRLFLIVSVSIASFFSIFGFDIMKILVPPVYYAGVIVLPFILFSKIFNQSVQVVGGGIELKMKTKHFGWVIPCVAGLNLLLNFYFIPHFGILGAAFTTCLASLVQLIIIFNLSQSYFRVDVRIMRIVIHLTIVLSVSLFINLAEIKYDYPIHLLLKGLIFIVMSFVPFIVGVASFKTLIKQLRPLPKTALNGVRNFIKKKTQK
jgi:O-antigen/teichoic acid export membrane protein